MIDAQDTMYQKVRGDCVNRAEGADCTMVLIWKPFKKGDCYEKRID